MKVAIIGANGQLGADVVCAFAGNGNPVTALNHDQIEVSSADSVFETLRELTPEFVVNTAAMHHVEQCERESAKAFAVNAIGARNLAIATKEIGATLVHVSTDYVFDGAKKSPYSEHDRPQPLSVYGNSKLSGEYFVRSINEKHFVLRTGAIYGKNPCRAKGGLNFVELMLKLARERGGMRVVDSEIITPTPTADIAKQIVILSRSDAYGLYHATSEGSCSWYEFAQEVFALTNITTNLEVARPGEFPAKVPRPSYSVLENCGLKKKQLNVFQPWQNGLRDYIEKRSEWAI